MEIIEITPDDIEPLEEPIKPQPQQHIYDNYDPKKKNKYYRIYYFTNAQSIPYAYIEERKRHLFWKKWKKVTDSIKMNNSNIDSYENSKIIDKMKNDYIDSRKKYNCIFQGYKKDKSE